MASKKSSTVSAVLDGKAGKPQSIKVRAKITSGDGKYVGYYGVRRIREGQVFSIRSIEELGSWMELVDTQGRPIDAEGNLLHKEQIEEVETDSAHDEGEDVL